MEASKRSTYIIAAISFVIILIAVYFLFIFQKSPDEIDVDEGASFVESIQDIDLENWPFVTLTPTADGAEIIISIENMNFFDKMEYELTYQADNPQISGEKLQRGAVETDIDTSGQKYKKSLLLGTASRGVRSPDTGITDGMLTLHLFKGDTEYLSETNWDRFQVGLSRQEIFDYSGNFSIELPSLGKSYWVIIADTVGVPPNASFSAGEVIRPIYGTFSVAPVFASKAKVTIKFDTDLENAKLYTYSISESNWQLIPSTLANKSISASIDSFSTFVLRSTP